MTLCEISNYVAKTLEQISIDAMRWTRKQKTDITGFGLAYWVPLNLYDNKIWYVQPRQYMSVSDNMRIDLSLKLML